ncbi:MAG: ImmA/IrrE family metallo-endopeptidase [Micrococcales bacterium]|nr:ImmA/IrrE family metallo-endopeptidase [Micrococcales bacterium]
MLTSGDLYDRASGGGVGVRWADLGGRSGCYDDGERTITLNLCLTEEQTCSTMAHELSHARWHDQTPADRRARNRQEWRADDEAAHMLISTAEYAVAEMIVGPDPGALADELGVSRWVVEAWQADRDGRGLARRIDD